MTGPEWPFRGREAEVSELHRLLDTSGFRAIRVSGRRRVGKSTFIDHVLSERTSGRQPVRIELPDPRLKKAGDAFEDLSDAAATVGFSYGKDPIGDLPDFIRFRKLLTSLIDSGAIVVLDEFHHARELGLADTVRSVIDRYRTDLRNTAPRGKLIVTGSHQQRMYEMLRDDQPLYGRFRKTIALGQWGLKTVLEMAAAQGFLRHPSRMLTMYTAFGGMPGQWEQFALEDPAGRDIDTWDDAGAWRRTFIEGRRRSLDENPEDHWDDAAFIELSPQNRAVFNLIASRGGGFTEAEIRGELGLSEQDAYMALKALQRYLQLIGKSAPFTGGVPRLRVCDNPALFQMRILGQGAMGREAGILDVSRLATLEGQALERMAAAWLKGMEGVVWSDSGVWMPGLADIDVVAERENSGDRDLILAGCRRNPEKHDLGKLDRQFNAFMASIGDSEQGRQMGILPHRRLLVSPVFTPNVRERYANSGFECVDILDMARTLGVEAIPEPEANAGMENAHDGPHDGNDGEMGDGSS